MFNATPGRLKRDKKAERGMSREEIKEAEEQVFLIFLRVWIFWIPQSTQYFLLASMKQQLLAY